VIALRVARAVKNWSIAELGETAGIAPNTICAYEAGRHRPSRDKLDLLRIALMGELERAEGFYGTCETRERGALKGQGALSRTT